jgi:hypothetical protein
MLGFAATQHHIGGAYAYMQGPIKARAADKLDIFAYSKSQCRQAMK